MSEWVVVPCDNCRRQTVTDRPDDMVICEVCLLRWDEEDREAGVPVGLDDDGDPFEEDDPFDDFHEDPA